MTAGQTPESEDRNRCPRTQHIGNLMDWCKDNLKHCKFSGPDLDLDLVQTAQQIPQLKTELSQLQALVRALSAAKTTDSFHRALSALESATLDATTPATPTHNGGA